MHDAGIAALLEAHKVNLVISGHDHIYERGWAGKLAYLVTGGGGAPTYKIKSTLPQTRKAESVRHFVDVGVKGSSLDLVAIRSDGSTIERCGLTKGAVEWDCDAKALVPTPPSSITLPTSPRSPSSSSRCACDVVGAPSTNTFH